jgi:hypothetical protein
MINLEYEILKLLSKDAYTVDQIKARLSRFNQFRIENVIEDLEESQSIEELFTAELESFKTQNIENMEGHMGDATGHYLDTQYGVACYEEEKDERFRFYMPFIFSAAISLVTVVVSVIALYYSLK